MKYDFAQGIYKFIKEIGQWLKDCLCHHKFRIFLGLVFLVVELCLYLGTDVMLEEAVSYHTGEGSWEEQFTEEVPGICQEFVPQYDYLQMISFLMSKEQITGEGGEVSIIIADEKNQIVFEESRSLDKVKDGRFTDVDVNLELKAGRKYYLTIACSPSTAGEYPAVGVCGLESALPESGMLVMGEEREGTQMVTRYGYEKVLPAAKARNIIIICLATAFGVMFGLPENKWLRRVAGVVLLLIGPYLLGQRLELLTYEEIYYIPMAFKWNVGIMYGLELLVLLCTHSPRVTIAVTNVVLTILYSVNYFVIMYRGTPLRINDFTAIGTATKVAGDYDFVPNDQMAFAWGILVFLVVFGVQTGTRKIEWTKMKEKLADRRALTMKIVGYAATIGLAMIIGSAGVYLLTCTDFLSRVGFADEEYRGFHSDLIYSMDGYLVATCIEVKNSRITPMEGYSAKRVEEILSEVPDEQEEVTEELPHVILVMNESFSDLRVLGGVELNQDNLVFWNSLKENTVRGYVNASVIGGGTANSEFEVFTGCSTAFLPVNYYPYQQAIRKPVNSLVSQMEKYGYSTYSMHPEDEDNWNRSKVYQYYGFDESLWDKDFEGAEVIHRGVSDAETYKRVIELYEGRQEGEKLFVFDLTMQNHGGYFLEDGPDEVVATNMQEDDLNEYLSLVKISDEAFAELIGYFEDADEKVVICMFGDHQPYVSDLVIPSDTIGDNQERLMSKYKTPFVIWANYDIEEADGLDISLNYLGGLLQRTAGIPLSPYFAYLEELRSEYPIITAKGYVDKDGNYYNWSSTEDEFAEYRMLQYNYLYDDTIDWGY